MRRLLAKKPKAAVRTPAQRQRIQNAQAAAAMLEDRCLGSSSGLSSCLCTPREASGSGNAGVIFAEEQLASAGSLYSRPKVVSADGFIRQQGGCKASPQRRRPATGTERGRSPCRGGPPAMRDMQGQQQRKGSSGRGRDAADFSYTGYSFVSLNVYTLAGEDLLIARYKGVFLLLPR